MCHRVQLQNENVREYFHEKVYLCKQVGLYLSTNRKCKFWKVYIRRILVCIYIGRDYRDEEDLLGDMVKYERLDASRAMRFCQSSVNIKDNGYISIHYDSRIIRLRQYLFY
jgi:hypothetical protein